MSFCKEKFGLSSRNPKRRLDTVKAPEVLDQEARSAKMQKEARHNLQTPSPPSQEEPPVAAQLRARFGYSYRDIAKVSKELGQSRDPDKDKIPEVRELIRHLRSEGEKSYSTFRRIVDNYEHRQTKKGVKKEISTKVVNLFTGQTIKDWSQPEEGGKK